MSNAKPRALGRGLSALLPTTPAQESPTPPDSKYFSAAIEDVYPSPEQPRRRFAEAELAELAQSIRSVGVIQPLVVRKRPEGGYYLIAGERRWRASQRAGLHNVPVVVHEVSGEQAFERALIENVQRADLNPVEEALAYQRLCSEYGHTQEQVASRVGKDRSTVANSLRLLKLPPVVRSMVEENTISMGHARALLAFEDTADLVAAAKTVVKSKLSVRATEALARKKQAPTSTKPTPPQDKTPIVRDLEERLTQALGAEVDVAQNKRGNGGCLQIRYRDLDHLDRLLEKLL